MPRRQALPHDSDQDGAATQCKAQKSNLVAATKIPYADTLEAGNPSLAASRSQPNAAPKNMGNGQNIQDPRNDRPPTWLVIYYTVNYVMGLCAVLISETGFVAVRCEKIICADKTQLQHKAMNTSYMLYSNVYMIPGCFSVLRVSSRCISDWVVSRLTSPNSGAPHPIDGWYTRRHKGVIMLIPLYIPQQNPAWIPEGGPSHLCLAPLAMTNALPSPPPRFHPPSYPPSLPPLAFLPAKDDRVCSVVSSR